MSTPIQPITSLSPAGGSEQAGEKSQAQRDFEEGRGYVERGEAALAAVSLHNALRGFEQDQDRVGIANAANQLGHACLLRQEYDMALVQYRRAWDICEELGDSMSLLALTRHLIEAHKGLKEYRVALNHCLDLLDTYQRNNNPKGSVEVLEMMADIYVLAEEPGKAADALRTAASIHANFQHQSIADTLRKKAAQLAGEAH
ncbi:MAG: tetratricopeptide repeat protein [Desulfofustis sp.]|nr:tetratricopeptide repeat protein [Desulfofustis sp.]